MQRDRQKSCQQMPTARRKSEHARAHGSSAAAKTHEKKHGAYSRLELEKCQTQYSSPPLLVAKKVVEIGHRLCYSPITVNCTHVQMTRRARRRICSIMELSRARFCR